MSAGTKGEGDGVPGRHYNLSYYLDYTLGERRKLKFDHIITLSHRHTTLLFSSALTPGEAEVLENGSSPQESQIP